MARGISENDVHQAADALVASGERPTVERIRGYLGTGSPNTVTRWLDTWWQGLGARLQGQATQLAIPGAPEAVTTLAGQLWMQALAAAQQHEAAELEADRTALAQERLHLQAERDAAQVEVVALRNETADARARRDLALAQARELHQLVNQLRAQIIDLSTQRDGSLERADRLEAERLALSARLVEYQVASERERESLEAHRRAFEDRAHREVDLARQAAKDARAEVVASLKTRDAREATMGRERDQALQRSAALQVELVAERTRRQALEEELEVLRPVAIQVHETRSGGRKTRRSTVTRRGATSPDHPPQSGNQTALGTANKKPAVPRTGR